MNFNPLDFDGMLDRVIAGEEKFPDSLVVAVATDEDYNDVVDGIIKERTAFGKLNLLLDSMTWEQKVAVCLIAIDRSTKTQLVQVLSQNGQFDEQVQGAIGLMNELQPETLIEMAIEILDIHTREQN